MYASRPHDVIYKILLVACLATWGAACSGDDDNVAGQSHELALTSALPATGLVNGGTLVELSGSAFSDQVTVTFGGLTAEIVESTATSLTVVTPPRRAGRVDIVVRDGATSVTSPNAFTYAYFIAPQIGPMDGSSVTLRTTLEPPRPPQTSVERDFDALTAVFVDSQPALQFERLDNNRVLSFVTPKHAVGRVNLELRYFNNTSVIIPQAFEYVASLSGGPRVVSAISLDNTHVRVTFSEPLGMGASDPSNYSIVQVNVNAESAYVGVFAAEPSDDGTMVTLTTASQNEVTYEVRVHGVRDLEGNLLASPELLVNPTVAQFAGTPPGGGGVDSDDDGLPDSLEQNGWTVTIQLANGDFAQRTVTSAFRSDDPTVNTKDTDQDGVSDAEEFELGSDPRKVDTDGDRLADAVERYKVYGSMTDQDSDDDGLPDGIEFLDLHTSLVLADTDGDQRIDSEEILETGRDPRVSDIPRPDIEVGEIALRIDERYTYIDQAGVQVSEQSATSTTLTQSQSRAYSSSSTQSLEWFFKAGFEIGYAEGHPFGKIGAEGGATWSNTFQTSTESALASQQAFQRSLSKGRELTDSKTVTREVVGASVEVAVTLRNRGDVPFTLSNLELTAMIRDPFDATRLTPLATLVPQRALATGEDASYNLGPFTGERGPVVFVSRDVFPVLVTELMKAPAGVVFKVANYDIEDEDGRDYSFADQEARDRTARIIIDYGDGPNTWQLVSVAAVQESASFEGSWSVSGFPGVGGFDINGRPEGVSLDYALQRILKMTKNEAGPPDGVVADVDQDCDTVAQGDDVQLVPVGTRGVSVGAVVVGAGQNGVLDPGAGDRADHTTGYATQRTCAAPASNAGTPCATDAACGAGTCTGPERLVRVGSRRDGDFNRRWFVLTSGDIPAGADFSKIMLKPAQDIELAFVQDLDDDRVTAREEYLSGSIDSALDRLANASFGPAFDESSALEAPDGLADSKDSDRDGLGDFAEVKLGWEISVGGQFLRRVHSDPGLRDSDGDGLLDPVEQNLRSGGDPFCTSPVVMGQALKPAFCSMSSPATDPRQPDTDGDAISDYSEVHGFAVGLAIVDGTNGIVESTATGDDVQVVFESNPLPPGGIVILPGANGALESLAAGDDVLRAGVRVVTDPLLLDTDDDSVSDGIELAMGANPVNPNDGDDFRDADDDGLSDVEEQFGWTVSVVGQTARRASSNASLPDTDFDGLPDFVERDLGTDPSRSDTDGDGLLDFDEASKFDRYLSVMPRFSGFVLKASDSKRYGTNALSADTDADTISDSAELNVGYEILIAGDTGPRRVLTNPLTNDTDLDGLTDPREVTAKTDATQPDTDGDGRFDGIEVEKGTKPLRPDIGVTVSFRNFHVSKLTDPGNPGDGAELAWWFFVRRPTDATPGMRVSHALTWDDNPKENYNWDKKVPFKAALRDDPKGDCYFLKTEAEDAPGDGINVADEYDLVLNDSVTFSLEQGQTFEIAGTAMELTNVSGDCGLPPTYVPTWHDAECLTRFSHSYSWNDFTGTGTTTRLDENAVIGRDGLPTDKCAWQIQATIETF